MARTPKVVEDRREQILDAAMRVFAQKGFAKATNKDIAREAGITPGLIYYYFESKEAVLNAILESRSPMQLLISLPAEMMALPTETFLRYLLQRVLEIVEDETFVGLIRVIIPEAVYSTEVPPVIAHLIQRILTFLAGYLDTKMEAGELRRIDAPIVAQILVGSLMSFVLRRQIVRDPIALQYTHQQMADTVIETVLEGLKPR